MALKHGFVTAFPSVQQYAISTRKSGQIIGPINLARHALSLSALSHYGGARRYHSLSHNSTMHGCSMYFLRYMRYSLAAEVRSQSARDKVRVTSITLQTYLHRGNKSR